VGTEVNTLLVLKLQQLLSVAVGQTLPDRARLTRACPESLAFGGGAEGVIHRVHGAVEADHFAGAIEGGLRKVAAGGDMNLLQDSFGMLRLRCLAADIRTALVRASANGRPSPYVR